jgi:hypothetical protein
MWRRAAWPFAIGAKAEPNKYAAQAIRIVRREMEEETRDNLPVERNSDGGSGVVSFALGVAAGVVATVIFATYAEEHFNRIIRKTRQLSHRAEEVAGDVGHKVADVAKTVKAKTGEVAGAAAKHAQHVADQLQETVGA